jgi:hypothetical protein
MADLVMRESLASAINTYKLLHCGLPLEECCKALGPVKFAQGLKDLIPLLRDATEAELDAAASIWCGTCGTGGGGGIIVPQPPNPGANFQKCLDDIRNLACQEPRRTILKAASTGIKFMITLPGFDPTLGQIMSMLSAIVDTVISLCDNPGAVTIADIAKACDVYKQIKGSMGTILALPGVDQGVSSFIGSGVLEQLESCCNAVPSLGTNSTGGGFSFPSLPSGPTTPVNPGGGGGGTFDPGNGIPPKPIGGTDPNPSGPVDPGNGTVYPDPWDEPPTTSDPGGLGGLGNGYYDPGSLGGDPYGPLEDPDADPNDWTKWLQTGFSDSGADDEDDEDGWLWH